MSQRIDRSRSVADWSADENPFAPPSVPTSPIEDERAAVERSQNPDLASIPAMGRLELPRMCVVSGSRDDLVEKRTVLRWYPVISVFGAMVFGLFGTAMTLAFFSQRVAAPLPIGMMLATSAIAILLSYSAWLRTLSVTVIWHVSRSLQQKFRRSCLAYSVAVAVIGAAIAIASRGRLLFVSSMLFLTSAYIAYLMIQGMQCLSVTGRTQKQVLIGGVPRWMRIEMGLEPHASADDTAGGRSANSRW